MTIPAEINLAAELIASAGALTETTFLEIGRRLEASATRLQKLAALFERLQAELGGAELRDATSGLAEVAAQVGKVAAARNGNRDRLARLDRLAGAIDGSVARMRTEIGTIGVLTVNARIVAAGLGPAGGDFLGYVAEIAPSLAATQVNLEQFDRELGQVTQHLDGARAGEASFEQGHGRAVEAIPPRLLGGIDVIGTRREQAATSAAAVGQRTSQIANRIGSAILALQVGDATRQRLEHAQAATQLFTQLLDSAGLDGADLGEPAWSGLDAAARQRLVARGCGLEAALLADAAEEFERDVETVVAALKDLSADALAIVRLGTETFAGADGGSPFLRELEADIQHAGQIFAGFRAARASADEMVGSLVEIATRLSRHIGTVRGLEADIRIMGFNTTFKCSRLGERGRPLAIISQELRACSTRTGAAAATVTADVEQIVATARELTAGNDAGRAGEVERVTRIMEESVAQLKAAGEALAAALATLAADGAEVAGLLEETVAGITARGEIGGALRTAASHMAASAEAAAGDAEIAPAEQALLDRLARRYTMAREREVHARVTGAAPAAATAAPADIDDMLF